MTCISLLMTLPALPISVQQYVEPRNAQIVFFPIYYDIFQQSTDLYSAASLEDTVMAKQGVLCGHKTPSAK